MFNEHNEEFKEICNENMVNDTIKVTYTLKVDNVIKCCCFSVNELNKMISYIINVTSFNLIKNGWSNVRCISENDKILWKVISQNKIITQIIGNMATHMLNYDIILSDIEVEINYVI